MGVRNPYFSAPTFILLLRFLLATEASDKFSLGQSLSGNRTIVSRGGIYEFGFFKPGSSHFSYAGIWFTFTQQTVVWVANREVPISNPWSSELKIHTDGNLVLVSNSKIIWSSNSTVKKTNTTFVVLEDNGNLILRDKLTKAVVWQSFDHPTDTWLPGAVMSRNKITGEIKKLTPWKSFDDPAPGYFSFSMDPKGSRQFILTWNDNVTYWRSGNWNGQYFSGIPEMIPGAGLPALARSQFSFSFSENKEVAHFVRAASNSTASISTRLFLDLSGQMKVVYWNRGSKQWVPFWFKPNTHCEVHALCGAFGICRENTPPLAPCSCLDGFQPASRSWNSSGWSATGCSRKHKLQCQNGAINGGDGDKFRPLQNVRWPENPHSLKVEDAKECEVICANNCSCNAYDYNNGYCFIWVEELLNIQQQISGADNARTLYLKLAPIEMKEKKLGCKWEATAMAIVFALLSTLFIFLGLSWIWGQKRKAKVTLRLADNSFVLFEYQQLKAATKNFSEIIGTGGFGTVFKGILPDSTEVAVKKINEICKGEKQFRAEVSILATIQHVNLVRLRGFCSNGPHGLLVYDFMPNGSFDSHIFNTNMPIVHWKQRYSILIGVAKGLYYLHEECRECIVHCDIKPENILLDKDFLPKVADLGLAKLIGRDFSRVLTTMRGTVGYLAPEWISGLPITPKVDVYSFGMMLFEVISGKRNMEQDGKGILFYPLWATKKVNENEILQLLDPRLEEDANMDELKRACRVACWCIQDCEADRPSMGKIVQILEGVVDVGMPPVPRFLQLLSEENKNTTFFSQVSSSPSLQS